MTASAVSATLDRLVERLLDARDADGHWTGELSSSALSTATAVVALCLDREDDRLVARGLDWIEQTQNEDGGWGDTTLSVSNISTTALCWAAFTIAGCRSPAARAGEEWMRRGAGGLDPERLTGAIAARYGNDRTFSVPILTVLAVAGHVPWRLVPQLPFELAACPQSWFRWLGLPVVSYALPALIAIGHARHRRCRSKNPIAALIRRLASGKTLHVLERIQPEAGGFLEATPLTSFVAISLSAAGYTGHSVLKHALRFLRASVRADGSWPIDTNLATWVTTLSVNALGDRLPADQREPIREWILRQQYREVHPYTGAAAGGWAWTDLPGGVPDADDTAGALLALAKELREGREVAVTPDGPRGPARSYAPGALIAAQRTGAPILPIAAHADSAWRLSSWDNFMIPKPFAKITIAYGEPTRVSVESSRDAAAEAPEFQKLMEETERRACG